MAVLASTERRSETLARSLHRHVSLFRLARRDGRVIRLTEHSAQITFDGQVYEPINSVQATATQNKSGLGESSFDASGAIDSDEITAEDLRAGRFRGCEVTQYVVDWLFPWIGAVEINRQWVFETVASGTAWQAQCGGLTRKLAARIGKNYERTCDAELGDDRCRVDVVPLSNYFEEITHVTSNRVFRITTLTGRATGWFNYGRAIWRSGANKDTEHRIEYWDDATKELTLAQDVAFPMAVGDRVDLVVGCDRRDATCTAKFANLVNFQGFPFLPTSDEVVKPATI